MPDSKTHLRLLEQNTAILQRHAQRRDLSRVREVTISARYQDKASALAARAYLVEKHGKQTDVLFRVVSLKYADGDVDISLSFTIEAVPDAQTITKYEMMLADASEQFGGGTPGWEIAIK